MPTNSETEPGGSSSTDPLQLPGGVDLAAPPNPVIVKGQRASLISRRPRSESPHAAANAAAAPGAHVSEKAKKRVQEMEERQREADARLPGEEMDEFGLPLRPVRRSYIADSDKDETEDSEQETVDSPNGKKDVKEKGQRTSEQSDRHETGNKKALKQEKTKDAVQEKERQQQPVKADEKVKSRVKQVADDDEEDEDSDAAFQSAEESPEDLQRHDKKEKDPPSPLPLKQPKLTQQEEQEEKEKVKVKKGAAPIELDEKSDIKKSELSKKEEPSTKVADRPVTPENGVSKIPPQLTPEERRKVQAERMEQMFETTLQHDAIGGVSAVSHQALAIKNKQEAKAGVKSPLEDEWQNMRAYGKFDVYDDDGKVLAKGFESESDDNEFGAPKGYTKLNLDEDAESQTSMDENTKHLFKEQSANIFEEDEEARDPLQQMQATKDMLTDGQRIAYVGLTRLSIAAMVKDLTFPDTPKKVKKEITQAGDAMKMWGQKMMVRLYAHMEIESSEQVMIEQLTEHGVQPGDLTPLLMQNARVKNPMAGKGKGTPTSLKSPTSMKSPTSLRSNASIKSPTSLKSPTSISSPRSPLPKVTSPRSPPPKVTSPRSPSAVTGSNQTKITEVEASGDDNSNTLPPPYAETDGEGLTVQSPSMLPATQNIDIDLRWTVLCDLFLVLIADSIYDSRSRKLLELVGGALEVTWMDICRFEKRVTDALEMEEEAARETWDETGHIETRRKAALRRRYMYMGLATVGGTLVIGLSAGLLAPVIGAGLGAGLTAIGVSGTTSFMAGAGGAAIITTASGAAGGIIAVRASNRRTGAVKTFEYRPLHNNKRVNLIVTISGWMNGKVDDVRLPFSTVDPIMGDIYSLLWEPDVLKSTGDTIQILATEALTQGLQHVLAATFLTTLMAGLSLPIVLSKLSYLIDNPWSVSLDRADAAGLILADSLIERNLGVRPITLVGFSLGARVIFSALRELAHKGAYGLIQNVYLFGSPVVAKKEDYMRAVSVISGRFVNGYATNDWIIGYLFRATSGGISRVAGLKAVEGVHGLENLDVTKLVNGHMAYRAAMPKLLREVGWEIESDEFAEIEDPDPENHVARQRELIKEIDNARQLAEKEEPKSRWGAFWQRKREKKNAWETYDVNAAYQAEKAQRDPTDPNASILFDLEAIRRELESEQLEVKEIESTLPPMRLDLEQKEAEAAAAAVSAAANGDKKNKKSLSSPTMKNKNKKKVTSPPIRSPRITSPKLSSDRWDEYDEHADGDGDGSRGKGAASGAAAAITSPSTATTTSFEQARTWGKLQHDDSIVEQHASFPQHLQQPALARAGQPSPLPSDIYRIQAQAPEQSQQDRLAVDDIGSPWAKRPYRMKPTTPVDLRHNAWAEEEAKEGEVKMTFE